MNDWHYVQLFLQRGTQIVKQPQQLMTLADTLLIDHVQLWIETLQNRGWIDRYFFIRYAEGGYHVRLRVHGQPDVLREQVQPFLQYAITNFYTEYAIAPGSPPIITFDWLQNSGYVRICEYEPEYAKYGGEKGMSLAEEHFAISSQVTMAVTSADRESGVSRGQYALDLIMLMLQAFSKNDIEHAFILKGHTVYWLAQMPPQEQKRLNIIFENHFQKQKENFIKRIHCSLLQNRWPKSIPNPSPLWRKHLEDHITQLRRLDYLGELYSPMLPTYMNQQELWHQFPTIQEMPTVGLLILPNYIHMLCNRLGLGLMQEAQLAYSLYRAIESQHKEIIGIGPVRLEPELGDLEKSVTASELIFEGG